MEKRERRKESRTRFVEDVEGIFIPDIIAKIYITQRWNGKQVSFFFASLFEKLDYQKDFFPSPLLFIPFFILIRERSLVDCWSRSKVLFSFFPFHNRWFFQKMGKINFSNGADRKVKLDRSFGRIDSVDWKLNSKILGDCRFGWPRYRKIFVVAFATRCNCEES